MGVPVSLAEHPTEGRTVDRASVYAKADNSSAELVHDDKHPVALKYQRLAAKQVNAEKTVFGMSEQRKPGRAVRPGIGAKILLKNAPYNVLVDFNAKYQGKLLCDSAAAPA